MMKPSGNQFRARDYRAGKDLADAGKAGAVRPEGEGEGESEEPVGGVREEHGAEAPPTEAQTYPEGP